MNARMEEIYAFVLPTMAENGIEDTPENRLAFLEGVADAWREDPEISMEKTFYRLALMSEINTLRIRQTFPRILG